MPNRVKELRRSLGITQKELATHLGVAQPTLSGWETDRFQIDYDNLVKLADFFNTSIDYILCRDTVEQNEPSSKDQQPKESTIRSEEDRLLSIYNSLDGESKTQLMSVAYMLMSASLKARGIDVQQIVEQQLHKLQDEGGGENDG